MQTFLDGPLVAVTHQEKNLGHCMGLLKSYVTQVTLTDCLYGLQSLTKLALASTRIGSCLVKTQGYSTGRPTLRALRGRTNTDPSQGLFGQPKCIIDVHILPLSEPGGGGHSSNFGNRACIMNLTVSFRDVFESKQQKQGLLQGRIYKISVINQYKRPQKYFSDVNIKNPENPGILFNGIPFLTLRYMCSRKV